ncbi:LacI family DNA-binding transcriptional regulator [Lacinutrix sp. MedPE-SW]|uniref:LacI family DNA-binding transcriptional regulator n=1 Tax=Lacinutrix sp. MedPE-SW TaxID=1860087 RepID=UPI00091D2AD2|nr:LacI family DNA-binding transcriptional regulator [Lacinutrix sp. MedPE-SW]OIQ24129.1 MAG: LacI family transcriptional regulator [Lacinutrix sp. MedPE-SW]
MITLKKIAEELQVSVSTVSKALHDSPEISDVTIAKVKSIAEKYNYRPNQSALNLKKRSTKTIGVIIPNILNYFFAKALLGIEEEATKQGYNIITCLSNESIEKEKKTLDLLSNGSVDGFILSVAEETQVKKDKSHFNNIINQKYPLVIFDRFFDVINCNKIIADDYEATYNATKHLIGEGRTSIALVSNISGLNVANLRINGYNEALKETQQEPIILNIKNPDNQEQEIEDFIKANKNKVDGIIAIDNTSGVIILNKALKLNISIPKDLSLIGFSSNNVLKFTNPKLSTIEQNPELLGAASVKKVIEIINSNTKIKPTTSIIKTTLELRETTL